MTFIRHFSLFTIYNLKQLQRKWLTLPLLFLFPVVLIGLCALIAVAVFLPDESAPIKVGLVDLDKSKETKMVVDMIEDSSQIGSYIQIENLTKQQAEAKINGSLSAYVTFPDGFTSSLYNGNPVTLQITGNPDKQTESYIVKELIDSIARHIRTSQANILTINHYAKQLPIDDEKRQEMLLKQFSNFVLYTVGKDKLIDEETVANNATASPVNYYCLAGWFTVLTLWLLLFYSFFTRDEAAQIKNRMRLYGVTDLQQMLAKILTTILITIICSAITFAVLTHFLAFTFTSGDYLRITGITLLYSILFLLGLAVLEILFSGQKVRLLVQSIFTCTTLLLSGTIVPTLYFPLYIQNLLPYSFGSEAFHWLQETILNGRLYTDYIPLLLMTAAGTLLFLGFCKWKERAVL